ncbi:MAG: sulfotransferase [bacterium]
MKPPVFIIGPPRSGTKILRDTVSLLSSYQTKEHNLNYVWNRYYSLAHDEVSPDQYSTEDTEAIRRDFYDAFSRSSIPVEKNVPHSLRLPAVKKVFPNARFVFIVRDGRDSVVSIRDQWESPIEWNYFLSSKLLEIPVSDILFYGSRQLKNYLKKLVTGENSVDTWGPQTEELTDRVANQPLLQVCIHQWTKCVRALLSGVENVNDNKKYCIKYEELMQSPKQVLPQLSDFLNAKDELDSLFNFARRNYFTSSIGRWKEKLTDEEAADLEGELEPLLVKLNYVE